MDDFNDTISSGQEEKLADVHTNLANADESFVRDLINQLSNASREVLYLDDLEVHTIDRAGDSPHDHVNQKEVVSGDATAWFAVEDVGGHGEAIEQVDIRYGVFAGSSKNVDGFIYDPIEVTVEVK